MDKVQGKWISELREIFAPDRDWRYGWEILDKVDVLLQIAALETDNESLHDDIMELIEGE